MTHGSKSGCLAVLLAATSACSSTDHVASITFLSETEVNEVKESAQELIDDLPQDRDCAVSINSLGPALVSNTKHTVQVDARGSSCEETLRTLNQKADHVYFEDLHSIEGVPKTVPPPRKPILDLIHQENPEDAT